MATELSPQLKKFFEVEIHNGDQDDLGTQTLSTATDSLIQAPMDVIASWFDADIGQCQTENFVFDGIPVWLGSVFLELGGLLADYPPYTPLEDFL